MLGENRVIERGLLGIEEPCALQYPVDEAGPNLPMRRLAVQREDAAIDHRVAPEPVRGAPAERLAVILPGQIPAEQLRALVVALIGAVYLRDDRQPVTSSRGAIKLDRAPILQPGVRVDPEVRLVAREVPRQKRPRHLRLECFRRAVAAREIDVPFRANKMRDAGGKP